MSGRVWRLGGDIDTDVLAPGEYMKFDIQVISSHCLESVRPDFVRDVKPGDVIVAGQNFGIGSSREQAPQALKYLGIAAVIAPSFAGLFYRNALNLGLPVLVCDVAAEIADGERIDVDPAGGNLTLRAPTRRLRCEPLPSFLLEMVRSGGLMPYLEKRMRTSTQI